MNKNRLLAVPLCAALGLVATPLSFDAAQPGFKVSKAWAASDKAKKAKKAKRAKSCTGDQPCNDANPNRKKAKRDKSCTRDQPCNDANPNRKRK